MNREKTAATLLSIIILLMASILTVIPATADDVDLEFKANGKLTHYGVSGPHPDWCEILRGSWDVKIKDGQVDFKFFYHELNLDEGEEYSPEGTIDHFRGYLVIYDLFVNDDGYIEIHGTRHMDKKMWLLDEYPESPPVWYPDPSHASTVWLKDFMVDDIVVIITPSEIEIGSIHGVTLNYHDSLFYGD